MESNHVRYDGGDVLIKPSWKSSNFFLVHRNVLSDRSPFFRAMLADRWSKPSVVGLDERATSLWTLYISPDTGDPENSTFVLTSKVPVEPEPAAAQSNVRWWLYDRLYTGLLSDYSGRDGYGADRNEECSCSSGLHRLCYACADTLARERVVEVHRCIFNLIYGKPFRFSEAMEPDRKILFLAELIHLAHLYSILDIASHKIERAFLEIEGLERHYHNCPLFFLEVGYYLQSEVMFVKAMEYIVGKGLLRDTTLPDHVLELEVDIRQGFSRYMGGCVQSISRVLAFREDKETTYEKPYRSLTKPQLKVREIAKTTLMNWITRNILQILELGEHLELPAWNWHKFLTAVGEQDARHLHGVGVGRLASRYAIKPTVLDAALKQQLERLSTTVYLQGLHESSSRDPEYDMFPCAHDNWYVGALVLPWEVKTRAVDHKLGVAGRSPGHDASAEYVPSEADFWGGGKEPKEEEAVILRDIDEYATQPASESYLASLGLTEDSGKLAHE
ncbi:hypothetical protein EPUS_00948 [Endocarpon pusillum Z07020]|uniref:BTB domain-containing protein n=1 Tax=Endocarpon pusillum (strain Z07020 / HMAS-L-300199) TaxID=1263415 RepID=U1HWD7_ENDPU|nr:uncharacterized protein EPUS_00948 [Endocarpon pusillum Z07020]ERF73694.1 hypothetical protein EPUS_00948 [Endocarpon pusillum Z07020]